LGELGVARRIDVIATAMMQDSTVFDLEDLELCYSIIKFFMGSTPLKYGKKYNWLFSTFECFGEPPFLASHYRLSTRLSKSLPLR